MLQPVLCIFESKLYQLRIWILKCLQNDFNAPNNNKLKHILETKMHQMYGGLY